MCAQARVKQMMGSSNVRQNEIRFTTQSRTHKIPILFVALKNLDTKALGLETNFLPCVSEHCQVKGMKISKIQTPYTPY